MQNQKIEMNDGKEELVLRDIRSLRFYLNKATGYYADYEKAYGLYYLSQNVDERCIYDNARIKFHAAAELVIDAAKELLDNLEGERPFVKKEDAVPMLREKTDGHPAGKIARLPIAEDANERRAPRFSEAGRNFVCDKMAWLCHAACGNGDCPVTECPFADVNGEHPCTSVTSDDWRVIYAHGKVFGTRPRLNGKRAGDAAAVNRVRKKGGQRAASPFWQERGMIKRMRHGSAAKIWDRMNEAERNKDAGMVTQAEAKPEALGALVHPYGSEGGWTDKDEWNEMEDRIRCAEMRRAQEDLALRHKN